VAPRKIIIDTDPGQDDAFAILFALGSPAELDVVAITTVGGNVPLMRTSENALKVVELAGRADIPVYAGCPGPMVRKLITAEYVHGETGLDGLSAGRQKIAPTAHSESTSEEAFPGSVSPLKVWRGLRQERQPQFQSLSPRTFPYAPDGFQPCANSVRPPLHPTE